MACPPDKYHEICTCHRWLIDLSSTSKNILSSISISQKMNFFIGQVADKIYLCRQQDNHQRRTLAYSLFTERKPHSQMIICSLKENLILRSQSNKSTGQNECVEQFLELAMNKSYGKDTQIFNKINVWSIILGLGMQKFCGNDAHLFQQPECLEHYFGVGMKKCYGS